MKKIVQIVLFLLCALPLVAQIPSGYVQTTATVPSLANGQFGASWTDLSSSPQLALLGCVSTFQQTVNGGFDAYGKFSVLLADTAQICPTPSTWTFNITYNCPNPPNTAFMVQVPVTGGGGTEDISAQITAALPPSPCGGATPTFPITIPEGGTGATTQLGANGTLGIPGPVINASAYPNLDAAVAACNAQTVPIPCYEIYVPSTIAIISGPLTCNNFVRLVGQSTTASIVQVGAFDGVYNCTPEHINFQSTSPSSGIGVRLSGLSQSAIDVQFSSTNPGTNKFSTGLESFGSVSDTVTGMYCEIGAASICAGLVSNGGDQTGNFTFLGGDLRGTVTGLYLSNVLSGSMHGGSIENSGTQGVLAANNPYFSFYFTEFESNGTSDVYWPTGGYAKIQGTVFGGGTTNNFNCPNTSCAAQLEIDGAIGAAGENWIIGNSIAMGSKFQNSFVGGTSFFTNNAGGLLSLSEISTHDSTVIPDTIGYNGDNASRLSLQPGSGGFPCQFVADNTGTFTMECNGVQFLRNTGNASTELLGSLLVGSNTILPSTATLPYVGSKIISGTSAPTDTCSSTVNTFAIEINATPLAYQCSNATGSYVWSSLGSGSGTFNALTGDATSTSTGGATTVTGLKGVPFCTSYTPTNGQAVTLTTASSPNPCYTAVTGGGGGSGTVTSFSAGNLSPLFTTSVATATSTPALTFSLSNAAQNSVLAGPASGGAGAPSYQTAPTISAANMTSFPTLNQATTNSAASLSISGQTGLLTFTGLTSTNRTKTVRDAADTILELGGSYTPTATWNWASASVTWPTFNQNTTGSAAKWTTARNLAGNSVDGSANVAFANKVILQGTTDAGFSSAQFLGALGTGIVKNTTTTGVLSIAAASDVYGLWSGSCSSSTYLRGDGACATPSGSSGLSGMTTGQVPIAASATTVTSSEALAGAGAAIVTGPASSTSGDAVIYTGTSGQTADAGFAPAPTLGNNVPETTSWTLANNIVYRFTGSGASNATTPAAVSSLTIASIWNQGSAAVTVVTGGPTLVCVPSTCIVPIGAGALITTDGTNFDVQISNALGAAFGTAANANTTGAGAAVTTGPTSSTNNDCVKFTGTAGQIADAGSACGSPGGSTGQLQYNNSGSFAGTSGGTTNGTHFAFGAGATVDSAPTSFPDDETLSPKAIQTVTESYTGADLENGIYQSIILNPSATATNEGAYGIYINSFGDGNNWSGSSLDGIVGQSSYIGSGTGASQMPNLQGVQGITRNTGAGEVGYQYPGVFGARNEGTGTTDNVVTLTVKSPYVADGGSITNGTGFDVQEQCVTGVADCTESLFEGVGHNNFYGEVQAGLGNSTLASHPVSEPLVVYADGASDYAIENYGDQSYSGGNYFLSSVAYSGLVATDYSPVYGNITALEGYEGTIDNDGNISSSDYFLSISAENNEQLEIDTLNNVGIGGTGMEGSGDTDDGDLFVDAGVGALEQGGGLYAANLTASGDPLCVGPDSIVGGFATGNEIVQCAGPTSATVVGTNTSGQLVASSVQGTISSGPALFGTSAVNTVIAQTVAAQAGHFTNLIVTSTLGGGTCTTKPAFNVFDGTSNTGTALTATNTTQTKGTATSNTQTQTFAAGDLIGIYISTAGSGCTADTWAVSAQYSTP